MKVVEFHTRPIDQWPGELTPPHKRKRSTFGIGYGSLSNDLARELELLKARGVAILMALREEDIRVDGRPRANTRPAHPGVIVVAGETKHGPLRWACDTYTEWTANLRAITLTIKNLRLIDGYGCTKRGEQYKGWAALPPPDGPTTRDAAIRFLAGFVGLPSWPSAEYLINAAVKKAHPDTGGSHEAIKKVLAAKKIIEGN